MGDGIGGREGRHFAVVREKLGGAGNAGSFGFRDVKLVATVVLHGGAHVPGFFAMGRPALTCVWVFEDEGSGSWWGEGRFVIVKEPVDLGVRRQIWIESGGAKEI